MSDQSDQPGGPPPNDLPLQYATPAAGQTAPSPGGPSAPPPPGFRFRPLYEDLIQSLTEPRRFYGERYPQMSQSYALAFGLGVVWLAAALSWLTRVLNHETFTDGFLRIRDQLMQLPVWKDLPTSIWAQNPPAHAPAFPGWLAEASTLALFPFTFLIKLVIGALLLMLGAYLFVQRKAEADRIDLAAFLKIGALTSTPMLVGAILSFLPLHLGAVVGWVYSYFMLLFAVSIRYRVSMLRAFAIVFTPWFALAMIGACLIGLFGAMIFGLIASILHVS